MENNTPKDPGFRPSKAIASGDVPKNPNYSSGGKPIVQKQGGVQSALNSETPRDPQFTFKGLVEQKSSSGRTR